MVFVIVNSQLKVMCYLRAQSRFKIEIYLLWNSEASAANGMRSQVSSPFSLYTQFDRPWCSTVGRGRRNLYQTNGMLWFALYSCGCLPTYEISKYLFKLVTTPLVKYKLKNKICLYYCNKNFTMYME